MIIKDLDGKNLFGITVDAHLNYWNKPFENRYLVNIIVKDILFKIYFKNSY